MSPNPQAVVLARDSLTAKQEAFARWYVECRSVTTAYRMAYDAPKDVGIAWVYEEASRTLKIPHVAAYVETLQEAAAAHTIVKARELVQDLADQASTDANELVTLHTNNCRHCYGVGFRYQWTDEDELVDAVEQAQADATDTKRPARMPDARGGFGYVVRRPPNPNCTKCEGRGNIVVMFKDTDTLSPRARKLYKGAKITSNGMELLTHDGQAARVELLKILGVYGKDGNTLNPAAAAQPVAADATEAEAAQAYLTMVSSQ